MSNNLKELTKSVHHDAERQMFAKILLSGNITPAQYHCYLWNQYHIYAALEAKVDLTGIEQIARKNHIRNDINELERLFGLAKSNILFSSTIKYIRYISTVDSQEKLLAHLYVRHFGDMYGGQIIKKRVPGSGSMYEFVNVEQLKSTVRERLTDDMADEAKICFNYATELFKELVDNE